MKFFFFLKKKETWKETFYAVASLNLASKSKFENILEAIVVYPTAKKERKRERKKRKA